MVFEAEFALEGGLIANVATPIGPLAQIEK